MRAAGKVVEGLVNFLAEDCIHAAWQVVERKSAQMDSRAEINTCAGVTEEGIQVIWSCARSLCASSSGKLRAVCQMESIHTGKGAGGGREIGLPRHVTYLVK